MCVSLVLDYERVELGDRNLEKKREWATGGWSFGGRKAWRRHVFVVLVRGGAAGGLRVLGFFVVVGCDEDEG